MLYWLIWKCFLVHVSAFRKAVLYSKSSWNLSFRLYLVLTLHLLLILHAFLKVLHDWPILKLLHELGIRLDSLFGSWIGNIQRVTGNHPLSPIVCLWDSIFSFFSRDNTTRFVNWFYHDTRHKTASLCRLFKY